MTDAVGLRLLDGLPDMAAESFGRHEPRRKLARMQADMDLGIELAQEADHAHMLGIVGHGDTSSSPPTKLIATMRGSAEASSKPNRVCAKTSSFGVLRNT